MTDTSAPAGGVGDQLRLLIEAQTDYALFLLSPTGHVATWNPGAARIKGYSAGEIIGEHFSRFYTDADNARRHPQNELEIALREGRYEEEGWRVRKDGSMFWANVVITTLYDARGTHVGFGKVTRDLSERRAAQERLQRSEAEARAEADRLRRRSEVIEQIGRAIVASSDLDRIVQVATDAATMLVDAEVGEFRPSFTGRDVVRRDDAEGRHGFGEDADVRSFLAVPVVTTDGEIAGGLCFGHPRPGRFGPEEEAAAISIARSTAVALVNARLLAERDRVAHVLQQSLLPPALPAIAGLELGSHYQSGSELVGGDYYDVFALGDERWGIVLGDVCGNGPEAASRTALTRHSVRTAAMFDHDPAHVLGALNTALLRSGDDRFTTAVFARIEPRPGGGFVARLASGGHPPPVLCHPDGRTEELDVPGPLLGIVADVALATRDVELAPGDVLVLYTDGLVEARSGGELYGPERLRDAIARHRSEPVNDIAEAVVAEASAFAGAVSDDIAIVVLRVVA